MQYQWEEMRTPELKSKTASVEKARGPSGGVSAGGFLAWGPQVFSPWLNDEIRQKRWKLDSLIHQNHNIERF